MALMSRVISTGDKGDLVQMLRDIIDAKPIGTPAIAMDGKDAVVLFDSALGAPLSSGTNAAVTTTAQSVSTTQTAGREVIIQADPANAANILLGGQAGQYIVLVAGASIALDWTDISTVWVKSASGTLIVNWLVRG
jgi:hypothetical protein